MAQELEMVTIVVQYKDEAKVIDAILKAGAQGVTYSYGRGTGVRQRLGWLGRLIEAEKILIFTVVSPKKTQAVVQAATQAASLEKPGNGFLCVHKVSQTVGFV